MKLCELLVLGHCLKLPLILSVGAFSGQSYNVHGFPMVPNFGDVIDTVIDWRPYCVLKFFELFSKVLI